jgi:hypothetical protein
VPDPAAPTETANQVTDVAAAAPDDADELRSFHFRRLLRTRLTLVLIAIAIVVAAGGGAFIGAVFIAIGILAAILISLLVVFVIADSKAEQAFFEAYASQHHLTLAGKGPLPAATPLLSKGDDRYGERILRGPLAPDLDGTLALYTYEDESTDSEGNRQTNYYRYTVAIAEIADCAPFVPRLICQRKFGFKALEKVEDAFRSNQRVELESEALDDRYEIFAAKEQDANWLRQLFSPTFIVWLSESAPKKFAFELVDGTLCCYVNGHKKSAAQLDTMSAAAATVARRLREEASE